MGLKSDFPPGSPALIQQAAAFSSSLPLYVSPVPLALKRNITLLPTDTTGRWCLEEVALLQDSEGALLCGWEGLREWYKTSILLFASKLHLRIAMLLESFPRKGGKDQPKTKQTASHTPSKPNVNVWVSYYIVRLSSAVEHRACPPIYPTSFITTYMQQLQKHLPVL